jgi:hypothetical protein
MARYNLSVLVIIAALMSAALPAVSEEIVGPGKNDAAAQKKELSIYGEVQSIDQAAGSFSVQYYDYDTGEEKGAEIFLNKETKLENASGISDIKQGDWVDVAYNFDNSKNIATSVIVEKEDEVVLTGNSAPETMAPSASRE